MFALACLSGFGVLAQNTPSDSSPSREKDQKMARKTRVNNVLKNEEEGEVVFNKHGVFGFRLATDGYGISYERGKFRSNKITSLLQFELNEKKSVKEHKISSNALGISSYIVGKENNFYQFKAAMGQQYRIGGKGNKNGVAVSAVYSGGVSVGLLKAYELDVLNSQNQHMQSTYPTIIDSAYEVTGASGLFSGWNMQKVKPGLNAKTALRFDYGRFNESITAIEVGLTGEYYFGKVPQMAFIPEKNFFFNAYVSILFGKRK